jgi:hypothetical protein
LNRNGGHCWVFSTRGLCTVAQDELVFIFDGNVNNANEIISDLLIHIHQIYLDATKGKEKIISNANQSLFNDIRFICSPFGDIAFIIISWLVDYSWISLCIGSDVIV